MANWHEEFPDGRQGLWEVDGCPAAIRSRDLLFDDLVARARRKADAR